ncbi:protein NRT1/ PTR FAMILY 1.2-like [Silene latifolia]|uniref:protein NRT1/ PTR FAMILY 1.2-like n=1 Tax=Silene latifolia TaxID=37657 RepID=UPI003D775F30
MESHIHEDNIDQLEKGMKDPLIIHPSKPLGGVRTLPFILANDGFERAAYYGLQPNMILYLMGAYGLDMATGSNIIFLWSAATNFTPILGALLADTYVGRFWMIGFGSIATLLGMVLLWSTTIIPGARPTSYDNTASISSTSPTLFQLLYLCFSLGLMSIGAGGIRSSALAFGADQLVTIESDENAKPESSKALASLFNWYYFSITISMLFALTCIVYIQDHLGWQVGFAVPVSLMLVSAVSFFSASSFYVKVKPMASGLTRSAQVVVAAWRNRHYKFSSHPSSELVYHVAKGSATEFPTEKLGFLNKACIVKDPKPDLAPDEMAQDPWCLCTTDQVEEFKSIMNMIPLWSTGIMLSVSSVSLSSFLVLQAKSMDRHIFTPSFEIPPASFGTFALISVMTWLLLYDRVIIPLASKVMGKPVRIDVITRMGIGLLLSFLNMVLIGAVENVRRGTTREGDPSTALSALWLVPQCCLLGLADAFTMIAQIEFFYSEFPRSMSCISSNLAGLCVGVSSLIASFILTVVNYVTKQGGKQSWVSSDPNKGHYDYYFWLLAGLNLLNYIGFVYCSRAYREGKRDSQANIYSANE